MAVEKMSKKFPKSWTVYLIFFFFFFIFFGYWHFPSDLLEIAGREMLE